MIEVVFGESEAGTLKTVKATGLRRTLSGRLEGSPDDVLCLGFLLDIGDIQQPVDSAYRQNLLYTLYARNAWTEEPDLKTALRQLGSVYGKNLERLKELFSAGHAVRIWYSRSPYALCGFYHLCSLLQNYPNEVRTVKLPAYQRTADTIVTFSSWGEVPAEELSGFLSQETVLSPEEIRMYALKWSALKEDGSPLRALVNGELTGVPEDFYDFLIWKRLGPEPVRQAHLIGELLGRYPIGISDIWYAKRINDRIREGRIEVVEDSPAQYARLIRQH